MRSAVPKMIRLSVIRLQAFDSKYFAFHYKSGSLLSNHARLAIVIDVFLLPQLSHINGMQ